MDNCMPRRTHWREFRNSSSQAHSSRVLQTVVVRQTPSTTVRSATNRLREFLRYQSRTPMWIGMWTTKFGAADLLPTQKNLVRRKHSNDHTCPCCGHPNGRLSFHLFQCRDAAMSKTYHTEMGSISQFLHTSSDLRTTILSLLNNLLTLLCQPQL